MGLTRSQIYWMALEEFINSRENEKLLKRLDEAYADGLDAEEQELLTRAESYRRRRLDANG
jgi:hypothetical protein